MNRPWNQHTDNPNIILDSAGQNVCLLAVTPNRDDNAKAILALAGIEDPAALVEDYIHLIHVLKNYKDYDISKVIARAESLR